MYINRARGTLTRKIYKSNVSWSLKSSKLSSQISNAEVAVSAPEHSQLMAQTQLKLRYLETLRKIELTYQWTQFFTPKIPLNLLKQTEREDVAEE